MTKQMHLVLIVNAVHVISAHAAWHEVVFCVQDVVSAEPPEIPMEMTLPKIDPEKIVRREVKAVEV
jgi:hypothetical protein